MNLLILALILGLALVPRLAGAAETETDRKPLQLRPKNLVVPSPERNHAPFLSATPKNLPELDLAPPTVEQRRNSPSRCNGESSLCYDAVHGNIVYRPARSLMPDLPGLHRENISINRHRILFRYSF